MVEKTKAYLSDTWFYDCPHCGIHIEDNNDEKERQVECLNCEGIFIVEEPDRKEGGVDG